MVLTKRQKDILYAIVTEFINTAEPVGSVLISEKYDIDASPATIRYEMVRLADEGFISKSYSSSGRIPTELGYKVYINELMDEEELHYLTEIKLRKTLVEIRHQKEKLIKALTTIIADLTQYAGVVFTENKIFYSGLYNLLDYPEFSDYKVFKNILIAFDDMTVFCNVFNRNYTDGRVKVLFGGDLNEKILQDCAVVFTEFNLYGGERAILACVGPKRMKFYRAFPLIRALRDIARTIVAGL